MIDVLKNSGLVILILAVVYCILFALRYVSLRLIFKAKGAKQSVRIRKCFKLIRVIVLVYYTYLILFAIIKAAIAYASFFSSKYPTGILIASIFFMALRVYASFSLPVSGMTLDKLRSKSFALYLRGFSSDDYNSSMEENIDIAENRFNVSVGRAKINTIQKGTQPSNTFLERNFIKAFKKSTHMPVYSVGMTKELESPEGSKRVYLNDETWQQGVGLLIDRAKYIFVLVNSSDSCIWEILQCQKKAKGKTFYFIDDEKNIVELQNKLKDSTPECFNGSISNRTLLFMYNGQFFCLDYQNNQEDFCRIFSKLFIDIDNKTIETLYPRLFQSQNQDCKNDKLNEMITLKKNLSIMNLSYSDEYNEALSIVTNSSLSDEQKEALELQLFLVHFGKKEQIDWDSIPICVGRSASESINSQRL